MSEGAVAATRAEVEDLFFHEADLLDNWRLDDWMKLQADDASYYVPPNDKPDGDHRFTLFTITTGRVGATDGDIIPVFANFVIYRYRRAEPPRVFVGHYRHKLRRVGGALKFVERRAILDAEELGALGSVSFLL